MKIKLHDSEMLKYKKENKKPELNNSEIIYLVRFPSYVTNSVLLFSFFPSKVSKLRKISYDVTI